MKSRRRTNTRLASSVSSSEPDKVSWATLDRLAPEMRRVLWEAPISINPQSAEKLIDLYGLEEAIYCVRQAALGEIAAFSAEHRLRYGYALPHVAARASVQTYDLFRLGRPTGQNRRVRARLPARSAQLRSEL